MNNEVPENYEHIRSNGQGFYEQKRGLISVWGKEALQFLDGLITNDMKTLEEGGQMLAAFPNAKGRLLAVVRVLRQGDRFLFETEDATREKVFQNLFRFTFAGDFFVEDLSDQYRYFELYGTGESLPTAAASGVFFEAGTSTDWFVEDDQAKEFHSNLLRDGSVKITDDLHEILRIENGVPKYGIDMDETTIVPELGLDGLISYNKGCYIGQEIIARIHFRGHVAKLLSGIVLAFEAEGGALTNTELSTADGKNAGRITSVTYSRALDKTIALAYVRYEYLADGTELFVDKQSANVKSLPFVRMPK